MYLVVGPPGRTVGGIAMRLRDWGLPVVRLSWGRDIVWGQASALRSLEGLIGEARGTACLYLELPEPGSAWELPTNRAWCAELAGALERAGLGHLVLRSWMGAGKGTACALARWAHDCEGAFQGRVPRFTCLRTALLMESFVGCLEGENRLMALARGDQAMALVARRDVVEMAARLCQAGGDPVQETVALQSGGPLTLRAVAMAAGFALGRPVGVEAVALGEVAPWLLRAGLSPGRAALRAEVLAAVSAGNLRFGGEDWTMMGPGRMVAVWEAHLGRTAA
jgi:hypothetical protein